METTFFHNTGRILRVLLVASLALCGEAFGTDHKVTANPSGFTNQSERRWSAKWIWQKSAGPANTWLCFRKQADFNRLPQRAEAFIAADSKYWLWINGSLVVFEGGLNRGPTPKDGYFDRIDIRPYLKPGTNTFALLVWYWGKSGRNSLDSGAGGLIFEIEADGAKVVSDSTWKVKPHPAHYGPLEGEQPSGIFAGADIGFDARNDLPGWTAPDFDDRQWESATEKGTPPVAPWNALWERPIPLWKNSGMTSYANQPGSTGPQVMELPYAAQITPYLKIKAPAGLKIGIKTDRYTVSGYNGQRTEYVTREGVQEFEALGWMFGEKVIYEIPPGVEILDLKYRETGYDTEFAGSFQCSDPFFNRFYEKARRTLYACLRDNYMDCPDRERGQWIGDACVQVPQVFASLDRKVDPLTLKCVRDFILWRTDDVLIGLVPGVPHKEYASQSLAAISEYGPAYTYYLNTGDPTPLLGSYQAMKAYVNLWEVHPNGSIVPRAKWSDGGKHDGLVLETIWYYLALENCITVANLTGNSADIPEYQRRMSAISGSFDALYWKGDAYRSGDLVDERANAMAVLADLAGKDKWPMIANILTSTRLATPYMESFVYRAMFKMGMASEALHRMKQRYSVMVGHPGTTLWEQFRSKAPTSDKKEPTMNHAWAGAPLALLVQDVAGIEPVTPGFETYQILPQLGPLTYVTASVPSIKGSIDVEISRTDNLFECKVASPPATTAIVGIPNRLDDRPLISVSHEDRPIWRDGKPVSAGGIHSVGDDADYVKFSLPPGSCTLKATYGSEESKSTN